MRKLHTLSHILSLSLFLKNVAESDQSFMTILHQVVTWFDVALAAATIPDSAGDAIRHSGLQPEAFRYLAVSGQRTIGRQISLVLGIWLAILTILLWPKRIVRLLQRVLWVCSVIFACLTGKRSIQGYRSFINKDSGKTQLCEKCDGTLGRREGRRGSPGNVSWDSIPISTHSQAPLLGESSSSTRLRKRGLFGMIKEFFVGAPKVDNTQAILERMDRRLQQRDEQVASLTQQVELLRMENQKNGKSFAGSMKEHLSKMSERIDDKAGRSGSRPPSAAGSK